MAHSRDTNFNTASPRSSSVGADSLKGTPDTKLTAFSPEDASSRSANMPKNFNYAASAPASVRLPVDSSRGVISHLDKDPFVTPTHARTTRLSPTASTFRPFTNVVAQAEVPRTSPLAAALSNDTGLSRCLVVSASAPLTRSEVDSWLTDQEGNGVHRHGHKHLVAYGDRVYIHFADIRDACAVHANIHQSNSDWKVDYLQQDQVPKDVHKCFEQSTTQVSQVHVAASVPPGSSVDTVQAMDSVRGFLESHGRLFAFVRRATFADGSFIAVAEFCHAPAAAPALASCSSGLNVAGVLLVLTPYSSDSPSQHDLVEAMQEMSIPHDRDIAGHEQTMPESVTPRPPTAADVRFQHPFAMYPLMFQSPFAQNVPYMVDRLVPSSHGTPLQHMTPMAPMSPTYSVMGSLYQTPPSPALTSQHSYSPSRSSSGYGRSDVRRHHAPRVSRSSYHNPGAHHNIVDIGRIREGIDVRTTIMLRNIPNKVDQAMLKRIVDESSWGKYDFMYLRIDFANDCNVGYAFINFVDPLDIIDFVDARGNQRWNCFKSDKVAEISYATIQGKDCLVQKFRNSSVMLEAPHYRPKLYFTSNGPMPDLAGQEEPFPDPDNQSKMKRSCENAEHVGLFTPNAGQHFRDEQRRRRSQYDRGTRLAALEEYDYEAAIQQMYGAVSH